MSASDMADISQQGQHAEPEIRDIKPADLKAALLAGLDDFRVMPTHLILLVIIYPILGLVLARIAFGYDMLPLLFPIVSGFALIGPLAAVGLYELSRRRQLGKEANWRHAFAVFKSPAIKNVLGLGLIQLAIYLAWLGAAQLIYFATFGSEYPQSYITFVSDVLTTGAGWTLIILGCGVGAIFAVLVLSISALSFPMLLDTDVGIASAIRTSVRAIRANPVAMSLWGIIVVVLLGVGSLPFFLGLAIVMPVLGHATWHLYRRTVSV
jgi:uncharacterized membrane protein